jgi:hypothetical protein
VFIGAMKQLLHPERGIDAGFFAATVPFQALPTESYGFLDMDQANMPRLNRTPVQSL